MVPPVDDPRSVVRGLEAPRQLAALVPVGRAHVAHAQPERAERVEVQVELLERAERVRLLRELGEPLSSARHAREVGRAHNQGELNLVSKTWMKSIFRSWRSIVCGMEV